MTQKHPTIRVATSARLELIELAEWWDAHRPDARVGVIEAFEETLEALQENPRLGLSYSRSKVAGTRRTSLYKSMPYMMYYVFNESKNEIYVQMLWSSMRPDPDI